LFERFGSKLQTEEKDGDYVFFSLNSEMLKSFTNTIYTMIKATSVFTFRFTDRGLHQTELADTERAKVNLHLFRHFFHSYHIERGLEVEVAIQLEDFIPQLVSARRKEGCDILYFVASNAGIASWAVTRNPKERTPAFCPKMTKKPAEPTPTGTVVHLGEPYLEELSQFVEDHGLPTPSCSFTLLSERFMKNATTFTKDKQGNHGNVLHLEYKYPKNEMSLSASAKALEESKCSLFYPESLTLDKTDLTAMNFRGTFSSAIVGAFCKLTSMLYVGIIEHPRPLLKLKAYYRELSLPRQESSFFELFLFDEDSFMTSE
jgi:hypothetical protein